MSLDQRLTAQFALEVGVTRTANFSMPATVDRDLDRFTELVITLAISAATHTSETYDLYITTGDGYSQWDIIHFPQIASTGAKTFTARITSQNQIPTNVTTANPGVSANDSAIFQTDTAGANQGIKTLGAGIVRHAPWGDRIGYELVCAGGGSPSITYTISVQGR